jgi:hypothetical protein
MFDLTNPEVLSQIAAAIVYIQDEIVNNDMKVFTMAFMGFIEWYSEFSLRY